MRRKRVYTDYLRDIAHYAAKVEQFVAGFDFEQFAADEEKGLAVLHALQIIGEAAAHLPGSMKQRYPDVPWADIVGMRNLIVHGYYVMDLEIVWKTVHQDLPPLRRAIDEIQGHLGQENTDT
ncbi:MAG: DUF86 domain-containing protein [Anaerolineae bacterium]